MPSIFGRGPVMPGDELKRGGVNIINNYPQNFPTRAACAQPFDLTPPNYCVSQHQLAINHAMRRSFALDQAEGARIPDHYYYTEYREIVTPLQFARKTMPGEGTYYPARQRPR